MTRKAFSISLVVSLLIFPIVNVFCQNSFIQETTNPKGWIIKTNSSVYQLALTDDGEVRPVYYGIKDQDDFQKSNALSINRFSLEIPVRGGSTDLTIMPKTPVLEVVFSDRTRVCNLVFSSAQITELEGRPLLKLILKDRDYPLELTSFIKVYPEYDMLEKWIEVRNTGAKEPILLENLQSGSVSMPSNEYILRHMAGSWANEYVQYDTKLSPGIKTIETRDLRSYDLSWFEVYVQNEASTPDKGDVFFGQLAYSGNWRMDFRKSPLGDVQVTGGINFSDSHWQLKPNTAFTTPKIVVGYTPLGTEKASQLMVSFVKNEVLPKERKNKIRQVLYNSWYATKFNINEEQQYDLAKIAKEIGVETFVIDAGWFEGTTENQRGLGDWTVDPKKFPNGLQPLIEKVNKLGMDFGIWIEPEVVSPSSHLFKAHPDWIFHYPGKKSGIENQRYLLNLAREDVYQYLLKTFSDLLSKHTITFIKWDYGRALGDGGWPSAEADQQREVLIRHTANLYKLIETLRQRFPNVWFEACAGGGGRTDLGMMSRMDQVWISDNTDPVDRLFMHYGHLSAYPANTMVCWTADEKWNSFHKQALPLDFKFDVAMMGVLGIGNDISKWNAADIQVAKSKVERYKQLREQIQNGTSYRLRSPYAGNRVAVQYVSSDQTKAVLCSYNLAEYLPGGAPESRQSQAIVLKGLNPNLKYRIDGITETVSGNVLMSIGIKWPVIGAYKSKIIELSAIR